MERNHRIIKIFTGLGDVTCYNCVTQRIQQECIVIMDFKCIKVGCREKMNEMVFIITENNTRNNEIIFQKERIGD